MNRKTPVGTAESSKQPPASFAFPWSVVGALLFFWLLWIWDFPHPMCDDLFYSGAGLNLASGGDLSNPLLARQHFPWHLFIIYPPVHSYALAAWLGILGISAATMTGFQMLMCFIIAAATIGYLRRQYAPGWLEWLVPLGVAAAFLPFGLRPEPLGVALTMTGFFLIESWGKRPLPLFVGILVLSLGISTAPRTAFFGAALLAAAGLRIFKNARETGRTAWRSVFIISAGILTAFLVFCVMLDFRLLEFWKAFRFHAETYVGGNKLGLLALFFSRYVGFTQWPVIPLLLWLFALSLRAPWRPLKCIGVLVIGIIPLIALVAGLGNGTLWYIYLAVFAFTATALQTSTSHTARIAISSLVIAVLLFANFKTFVNIAGILSGNITSAPSSNRAEVLAMRSSPRHPVLVDEFVARYIFDYRIPEQFIYWPFSAPYPLELATDTALLPDDIYLLGPLNVDRLNKLNLTHMPQPMWGIWKKRWSFYREPQGVYIIAVKDLTNAQTITNRQTTLTDRDQR